MTLQAAEAAAAAKGFTRLTVGSVREEADGVVSVLLEDPDGGALPDWEPGAHIDVLLPNGLLRQYSLCSDPADNTGWRFAVLREADGRGGSTYIHDSLRPGDVVEVRGPKHNFQGSTPAQGVALYIAGGIGITPLLPMIRATESAGRPWRLLYLGRSLRSMAFLDELAALDPDGSRLRIHAKDESGALALPAYLADATGAAVYACGPARLLDELRAAHAAGTVAGLVFEDFGGSPLPGETPDGGARGEAENAPFVVETADGTEVEVSAAESILDALHRAGVPALNSCRKGTCGTCETPVLDGIPEHRDGILSEEEREANDTMMICVSRCRGERLVLDL
ncbi:PDR/VanB family oxidoreductase [Arthrobacter celericrescens]|uniref:PDR/VanB family oxidoreductase n=1 Tax=Arthrobacter celericrescens TaxID=2320851 RepID=UPI000EA0DBCF|nr:PDR/VanB family oxidoreductase [Arthrobacter celericrescens]